MEWVKGQHLILGFIFLGIKYFVLYVLYKCCFSAASLINVFFKQYCIPYQAWASNSSTVLLWCPLFQVRE